MLNVFKGTTEEERTQAFASFVLTGITLLALLRTTERIAYEYSPEELEKAERREEFQNRVLKLASVQEDSLNCMASELGGSGLCILEAYKKLHYVFSQPGFFMELLNPENYTEMSVDDLLYMTHTVMSEENEFLWHVSTAVLGQELKRHGFNPEDLLADRWLRHEAYLKTVESRLLWKRCMAAFE